MKPLNQKDRRSAMLRFSALFALSIIPIVFAVYRFARIEDAELSDLRSRLELQEKTSSDSQNVEGGIANVHEQVSRLTKVLSDAAGRPGQNFSTEIANELDEVRSSITDLSDEELAKNSRDLLMVSKALQTQLEKMNSSMYKELHTKWDEANEDLVKKQKLLQDCQDRNS